MHRGVIEQLLRDSIISTGAAREMLFGAGEYELDLEAWRADKMADEVNSAGSAPPKMALGDATKDYGEFLGVVTVDEWVQGKEGGWQWHICVKPTDFDVGGNTQAFHTWYKYSDRKSSKMGVAHEAMQSLPEVFPAGTPMGEGKLVGKVAWWTRNDIEFGKDKNTGEVFKAEGVLIPIREADEADTKRARAKVNGQSSASPPAEQAEATDMDEDTINAAIELLDGKDRAAIQMAIAKNRTLPKEVKAAILSGELATQLAEAGLVSVDDAGVAHSAAAA